MFYLIWKPSPYVLNLESRSLDACRESIGWQARVGTPREQWAICTWEAERGAFVDSDGAEYRPGRGPYTVEAWQRFTASLATPTAI